MTPIQVARLAIEWNRANGANVVDVVRRTAEQYRFSPEMTTQALEAAAKAVEFKRVNGYWSRIVG